MKHIDSPRPLLFKPVKPRASSSTESPGILARPKDRPRFSYDGRETREKSAIKVKELPRLSLDSREASIRREIEQAPNKNTNLQQEPGSNKRPSSLVAKLMGLEEFPDTISSINDSQIEPIKTGQDETSQISLRPSRTDEAKQYRVAGSPRNPIQDSTSPRSRNTSSAARLTGPSPNFPQETAHWRQRDGSKSSRIRALESPETPIKPNSTLTVYGEIEKRMAEIQFRKSGKDLRALTHILKAMQKTKEMLDARNEDQDSQVLSQRVNSNPNSRSNDQGMRIAKQQNPKKEQPTPAKIKVSSPSKNVAFIKPNKDADPSDGPASSEITVGLSGLRKLKMDDSDISRKDLANKQRAAKSQIPSHSHSRDPSSRSSHFMEKDAGVRVLRSTQALKEFPDSTKEKTTGSKSPKTMSPRFPQKIGFEKLSHSTIPSLELRASHRQSNRQKLGSALPGTKLQPKGYNLQQSDYEMSEVISDTRSTSRQGDMVSMLSNLASQNDAAEACTGQPSSTNGIFCLAGQKHKHTEVKLDDDGKMVIRVNIQEQPSPVSVLDAMFYRDDSPSPVKKVSNAFQYDETLSSDEGCNSSDHDHLNQTADPVLSLTKHHNILDSREHMTVMHRKLNYADEEPSMTCTALTGKETNPDCRYIYEILSASGLLQRDLDPNRRVASSGHTINPDLFLVLEQTKASSSIPSDGDNSRKISQAKSNLKIHRKLVFDTVDEILLGKLDLASPFGTWPLQGKLTRRNPWGQQLLTEVCSELDCLQDNNSDSSFDHENEVLKSIMWEDPANQTEFRNEISGIVLDVERLIFKDLVVEVLRGEAALRKPGHN